MQLFPVEYSTLSAKDLLQLVLNNYDVDEESAIFFLKRGFNDTYLINSNKEKYILRIYKYNWRSHKSIESEIQLLNHLKNNGVSVSSPISDKNSNSIQVVSAPEGERYGVLFSYAEGERVRKLSLEQSYLLGVETGKVHSLTKDFSLAETARNYDITAQFEYILKILKPILIGHQDEYKYLLGLREEFLNTLNKIDKTELPFGICHGDLQAENFHITSNNKITFFDFDFFGTGYLIYDIGVFLWYDHKNKTPEIVNSFLKGYKTKRELTSAEMEILPYMSTLRALFQMSLYCEISDGKQLPLWPAQQVVEFIQKVKRWFTENV